MLQEAQSAGARRVAVVGAGLAGLAAARELSQRGFRVVLWERDLEVGGRAQSVRREGFAFEPAGQGLASGDQALLKALRELGLEGDEQLPAPSGLAQVYGGQVQPCAPTNLLGLMALSGLRLAHALRAPRLGRWLSRFRDLFDARCPELGDRLDDRSAADFARLYFGDSALERWLGPFLNSATSCDLRETSRLLLMLRYASHWRATPRVVASGLGNLARALAEGIDVRLGYSVLRVERAAQSGFLLRCTRSADAVRESDESSPLRNFGGMEPEEFDAVVLALPATGALRLAEPLLSTPEREFLGSIEYLPAITAVLETQRIFEQRAHCVRVPSEEHSPLAVVRWENGGAGRRAAAGSARAVVRARAEWSRAHLSASDDALRKELIQALEGLYPGLEGQVRSCEVFRYPAAVPAFPVGRFRALRQFRAVEADFRRRGRSLYFAGDYLAGPFLESAYLSGLRAAEALSRDFANA